MKRAGLLLMLAVALAAALTTSASAAAPESEATELKAYLARTSWPLRAASLRTAFIARTIAFWTGFTEQPYGDPPALGQIAAGCTNLKALDNDPRGMWGAIDVPRGRLDRLTFPHLRLSRELGESIADCADARRLALKARDENSAVARTRARTYFLKWMAPQLTRFAQALAAWRLEVLRFAPAVGVSPPAWVRQLR